MTRSSEYEWVIMPLQMRVYGFDDSLKPMSTKDIRVELTVQLPAENRPSHIVFQYVAAGAGEQDYLVVAVRHQATPRQGDANDAGSVEPARPEATHGFVLAGSSPPSGFGPTSPRFCSGKLTRAGRCAARRRLPGMRRGAGQPRAGGENIDRRVSALSLRRRVPAGRPARPAKVSAAAP